MTRNRPYRKFSPFITVPMEVVLVQLLGVNNPPGIYLLKVNNRNTRTRCEICSNLTIKVPERRRRSGVFIANFEHVTAAWEEQIFCKNRDEKSSCSFIFILHSIVYRIETAISFKEFLERQCSDKLFVTK